MRTCLATLIVFTAIVSVGITAPQDGPFTIDVHPFFLRLHESAVAESRAHALGLDIDLKFWTLHVHFGWSAIPLAPTTTKPAKTLL